jgi:hypothetical protein
MDERIIVPNIYIKDKQGNEHQVYPALIKDALEIPKMIAKIDYSKVFQEDYQKKRGLDESTKVLIGILEKALRKTRKEILGFADLEFTYEVLIHYLGLA